MNNSIIVIPDIHGRMFWKKVVDSELPIVFLGDYLDPYGYEGISFEDALYNFLEIIKFARERNNVTLLMGNHDSHYFGMAEVSTRFNAERFREIYALFEENKDLFKIAYKVDNVLFTHAGVSAGWLNEYPQFNDSSKIDELLNNEIHFTNYYGLDYIKNPWSSSVCPTPVGQVGRDRGGFGYGGPLWGDLGTLVFSPGFGESLIQIVGHTQLSQEGFIYHKNSIYGCDSRDAFVWNGEDLIKFDDYINKQ